MNIRSAVASALAVFIVSVAFIIGIGLMQPGPVAAAGAPSMAAPPLAAPADIAQVRRDFLAGPPAVVNQPAAPAVSPPPSEAAQAPVQQPAADPQQQNPTQPAVQQPPVQQQPTYVAPPPPPPQPVYTYYTTRAS